VGLFEIVENVQARSNGVIPLPCVWYFSSMRVNKIRRSMGGDAETVSVRTGHTIA